MTAPIGTAIFAQNGECKFIKKEASNNRIHTKLVDTSAISGRAKAA